MTVKSSQVIADHHTLVDDIILHEDDLTEEAKSQFEYHTKILNMFEQNRCYVLENDQIAPLGRHMILSRLGKAHADCKRVLNYAAANRELLSGSLASFGPLILCGLSRTGSTSLYNLLVCDPNCRAPLFIDMFVECVPPTSRSDVIGRERRMLIAKKFVQKSKQLVGRPDKSAASYPSLPSKKIPSF